MVCITPKFEAFCELAQCRELTGPRSLSSLVNLPPLAAVCLALHYLTARTVYR